MWVIISFWENDHFLSSPWMGEFCWVFSFHPGFLLKTSSCNVYNFPGYFGDQHGTNCSHTPGECVLVLTGAVLFWWVASPLNPTEPDRSTQSQDPADGDPNRIRSLLRAHWRVKSITCNIFCIYGNRHLLHASITAFMPASKGVISTWNGEDTSR